MKKLQWFAAVAVAVALTACGGSAEEADATNDSETEVQAPEEPQQTQEPDTSEVQPEQPEQPEESHEGHEGHEH